MLQKQQQQKKCDAPLSLFLGDRLYLDFFFLQFNGKTKVIFYFYFLFSDVHSGRTSFLFIKMFQIYLHSFPNYSSTLFDLDYFAINVEVNNNDYHIINVIVLLYYHI